MKTFRYLFLFFVTITLFSACSGDDDIQEREELFGDHSFTYTVSGPSISNQTYSATIPNGETLCFFSALPNTPNTATYFSMTTENRSILGVFLRENNTTAPLGPDNGDVVLNSVLNLIFQHQGEFYTLESLSGECVSLRYEIRTPGNPNAGTASIKVSFNGTFLGGPTGTNDPEEYQVSGEVDMKFVND
ncbi:MAG: hypothetical protein H0X63_01485 [Flavobacteriales bacterium]|nr:hypothetical protein [Flavobacteriales bacterium]